MKCLFAVFLSVTLICCSGTDQSQGDSDDPNPGGQGAELQHEESDESVLYSIISDLNIRDGAGKKGKVIGVLKYGQRVMYANEKTDYKESIKLRMSMKDEPWLKVKYSAGAGMGATEGWVYGGGVVAEELLFKRGEDGTYKRQLFEVTKEELSDLVGVELTADYYFNGEIEYTKSPKTEQYIKNGSWKATGKDKGCRKQALQCPNYTEYAGEFKDNKSVSLWKESDFKSKTQRNTEIFFENGKCLWSRVYGTDMESDTLMIQSPEQCSFGFIRKITSKAS